MGFLFFSPTKFWFLKFLFCSVCSRKMAQETNQTPGPMLCSTGCGFYGNPRTNGMCSVCYKEHLQRQQNSGRMSPMGKLFPRNNTFEELVAAKYNQNWGLRLRIVAESPRREDLRKAWNLKQQPSSWNDYMRNEWHLQASFSFFFSLFEVLLAMTFLFIFFVWISLKCKILRHSEKVLKSLT